MSAKITIALPSLAPRNPHALAARLRRAGAMGDRRKKRARDKDRSALERELREAGR